MIDKLKTLGVLLLLAVSAQNLYANQEQQNEILKRYNAAKLEVKYQGSVGDFAQELAQNLGVAYYTFQANSKQPITLNQDTTHTVSDLLRNINTQLANDQVQLAWLGEQLTLVLLHKQAKLPIQNMPQKYIGQINFDANAQQVVPQTTDNTAVAKQEVIKKPVKTYTPKQLAQRKATTQRIHDIIAMSKNQRLLNKYKREAPSYTLEDPSAIKLQSITSSKIATFLIFDNDVDVEEYKFYGDFQEVNRIDNVVAILHRQKPPLARFTVEAANGNKQTFVLGK